MHMEEPALTPSETDPNDRRTKSRFQIRRELRYKVLGRGKALPSGIGSTVDIGSGGVAFHTDQPLPPGRSVELSISWPAMLDDVCRMRLNIIGRVLRVDGRRAVCTVDKHEFRTQGVLRAPALAQNGTAPWMVGVRARSSVASA